MLHLLHRKTHRFRGNAHQTDDRHPRSPFGKPASVDVTNARNRRVDKRLIHGSATRTRTASEIRLNPFAFGFVTAVRQRPITEP